MPTPLMRTMRRMQRTMTFPLWRRLRVSAAWRRSTKSIYSPMSTVLTRFKFKFKFDSIVHVTIDSK